MLEAKDLSVVGVIRVIDAKHHVENNEIIKSSNGQPIPHDEPLILFRGRDKLALGALLYYKNMCIHDGCTIYQMESLQSVIDKFEQYAKESPTMKQPGITEGR